MSRNILQGLVGAWCPSLGPSGYTLLDRSGRGNHGTLTNMTAEDWVGGPGGWVLDFDGTNDQVAGTALMPTTNSRSVFQWVNHRTAGRWSFGAGFGNYNQGFFLGINSTALTVTQYGASVEDTVAIPLNSWQFIGATHTGNSWKLYRNGVQVNSGTMTTTPTAYAIYIGSYGGGGYANAQVSDTGVWQREVTAAEVAMLYQLGIGGLGRLLTQRAQRRVFRTATGNRRRRLICGAEC